MYRVTPSIGRGKKACPEIQEGVGEAEEPGEPPALEEEDYQEAKRLQEKYG